jgi:hypothetical protein
LIFQNGCTTPCGCPENVKAEKIIAPGATLQEILTAFTFTEGPATDTVGNVYLTNDKGVTVFDTSGKQIEQIKIPQHWTANVTFSGKNRKKTVYRRRYRNLYVTNECRRCKII